MVCSRAVLVESSVIPAKPPRPPVSDDNQLGLVGQFEEVTHRPVPDEVCRTET